MTLFTKSGYTYWKTDICSLRVNSTHLKNGLDASGTRLARFTCPNNALKSSCPQRKTAEWTCCFMGFMISGHYRTFSVLRIFVITPVHGGVLKGSYDKLRHQYKCFFNLLLIRFYLENIVNYCDRAMKSGNSEKSVDRITNLI